MHLVARHFVSLKNPSKPKNVRNFYSIKLLETCAQMIKIRLFTDDSAILTSGPHDRLVQSKILQLLLKYFLMF